MKNIILSVIALMLIFATACNNDSQKKEKQFVDGADNTNLTETITQKNQGTITINIDGSTYTFEMSDDKSELKFYTKESILNVDAACEIRNEDGNSSVDVIIEGMGKGKDQYQGIVSLSNTQSLASFAQGDNKFTFIKGNIEIEEFSKNTGVVKLKVSGIGTMQKGNSYKDMKVDVPAEMNINLIISNIRTFNYTKSQQ